MYLPNYNDMKSRKKRVVAKTKLNKYETYELEQPEMPNFTCPYIDEVVDWSHKIIDKMEEIRNMNTQLRDNAEFWKSACEEMQEELNDLNEWKSYIKDCVNR
tara:strand:- start:3466 stop:3771 length:306 start_codon:yes stop_codon:yes gene_type:complete